MKKTFVVVLGVAAPIFLVIAVLYPFVRRARLQAHKMSDQ